jgi:hypothetical protein
MGQKFEEHPRNELGMVADPVADRQVSLKLAGTRNPGAYRDPNIPDGIRVDHRLGKNLTAIDPQCRFRTLSPDL